MPRHYTDEEKRLVLDRLIANHGDVPRTAAETGINKRTLYLWLEDPKFTDIATEIAHVKMKNVKNFVQNPVSSPSLRSGEGQGEGIGIASLPPETTEAFQTLHDKLLAIADTLSNRIVEAIDDAPLNQRMTALSQLIDRIAKLAAQLPQTEEPVEYVYKYKVAHHVEKEDDNEEDSHDYGSGDRTGNQSA